MAQKFSKAQQQTLYQIAQGAKTPDVPFEDKAGEFMEQALTPEERQQVPDFEGTPEGLVEKEGEYDPKLHERSLRKHRYINMANELAEKRMNIDKQAMELKDQTNLLSLRTIRMGAQLIQSGAISQGMAALNTVLPPEVAPVKIVPLKNNNVKVYSQMAPDGEVINIDNYIKGLVSDETQFKEQMALRRQREDNKGEYKLKANEYKRKDGSIVTTSELRAEYKMDYKLMDEFDLRMLQNQNPTRYAIEKAKYDNAPPFRQYAKLAHGIDVRGGQSDVPPGMTTEQIAAERALGIPAEVSRLKKGESMSKDGYEFRRNSKTGKIQKRRIR